MKVGLQRCDYKVVQSSIFLDAVVQILFLGFNILAFIRGAHISVITLKDPRSFVKNQGIFQQNFIEILTAIFP